MSRFAQLVVGLLLIFGALSLVPIVWMRTHDVGSTAVAFVVCAVVGWVGGYVAAGVSKRAE